jgi:hypothetical protein
MRDFRTKTRVVDQSTLYRIARLKHPVFSCTRSHARMGILALLGIFVGLSLSGCGVVSSAGDDDHLEHHVPEHKPATFAAAIEQIRIRHERLATEFQTADAGLVERDLSELLDIVGWLTELAADSPMKKPEWDQVNRSSKELLAVYQRIVPMTKDAPRGKWPAETSRVDELMASLTKLIPFAEIKL